MTPFFSKREVEVQLSYFPNRYIDESIFLTLSYVFGLIFWSLLCLILSPWISEWLKNHQYDPLMVLIIAWYLHRVFLRDVQRTAFCENSSVSVCFAFLKYLVTVLSEWLSFVLGRNPQVVFSRRSWPSSSAEKKIHQLSRA